ncbi:hypothetical protein KY306_00335 [Candidatus Woesearchaeota archaeon]|nr:hypothetical protein [Candidatus Woesearchaeota archaeon]
MKYSDENNVWYSVNKNNCMVKDGQTCTENGKPFVYIGMVTDLDEVRKMIDGHRFAGCMGRSRAAFDFYRQGELYIEGLDFDFVRNCLDQGVALAFINDAKGVEKLVITTKLTGFEE